MSVKNKATPPLLPYCIGDVIRHLTVCRCRLRGGRERTGTEILTLSEKKSNNGVPFT